MSDGAPRTTPSPQMAGACKKFMDDALVKAGFRVVKTKDKDQIVAKNGGAELNQSKFLGALSKNLRLFLDRNKKEADAKRESDGGQAQPDAAPNERRHQPTPPHSGEPSPVDGEGLGVEQEGVSTPSNVPESPPPEEFPDLTVDVPRTSSPSQESSKNSATNKSAPVPSTSKASPNSNDPTSRNTMQLSQIKDESGNLEMQERSPPLNSENVLRREPPRGNYGPQKPRQTPPEDIEILEILSDSDEEQYRVIQMGSKSKPVEVTNTAKTDTATTSSSSIPEVAAASKPAGMTTSECNAVVIPNKPTVVEIENSQKNESRKRSVQTESQQGAGDSNKRTRVSSPVGDIQMSSVVPIGTQNDLRLITTSLNEEVNTSVEEATNGAQSLNAQNSEKAENNTSNEVGEPQTCVTVPETGSLPMSSDSAVNARERGDGNYPVLSIPEAMDTLSSEESPYNNQSSNETEKSNADSTVNAAATDQSSASERNLKLVPADASKLAEVFFSCLLPIVITAVLRETATAAVTAEKNAALAEKNFSSAIIDQSESSNLTTETNNTTTETIETLDGSSYHTEDQLPEPIVRIRTDIFEEEMENIEAGILQDGTTPLGSDGNEAAGSATNQLSNLEELQRNPLLARTLEDLLCMDKTVSITPVTPSTSCATSGDPIVSTSSSSPQTADTSAATTSSTLTTNTVVTADHPTPASSSAESGSAISTANSSVPGNAQVAGYRGRSLIDSNKTTAILSHFVREAEEYKRRMLQSFDTYIESCKAELAAKESLVHPIAKSIDDIRKLTFKMHESMDADLCYLQTAFPDIQIDPPPPPPLDADLTVEELADYFELILSGLTFIRTCPDEKMVRIVRLYTLRMIRILSYFMYEKERARAEQKFTHVCSMLLTRPSVIRTYTDTGLTSRLFVSIWESIRGNTNNGSWESYKKGAMMDHADSLMEQFKARLAKFREVCGAAANQTKNNTPNVQQQQQVVSGQGPQVSAPQYQSQHMATINTNQQQQQMTNTTPNSQPSQFIGQTAHFPAQGQYTYARGHQQPPAVFQPPRSQVPQSTAAHQQMMAQRTAAMQQQQSPPYMQTQTQQGRTHVSLQQQQLQQQHARQIQTQRMQNQQMRQMTPNLPQPGQIQNYQARLQQAPQVTAQVQQSYQRTANNPVGRMTQNYQAPTQNYQIQNVPLPHAQQQQQQLQQRQVQQQQQQIGFTPVSAAAPPTRYVYVANSQPQPVSGVQSRNDDEVEFLYVRSPPPAGGSQAQVNARQPAATAQAQTSAANSTITYHYGGVQLGETPYIVGTEANRNGGAQQPRLLQRANRLSTEAQPSSPAAHSPSNQMTIQINPAATLQTQGQVQRQHAAATSNNGRHQQTSSGTGGARLSAEQNHQLRQLLSENNASYGTNRSHASANTSLGTSVGTSSANSLHGTNNATHTTRHNAQQGSNSVGRPGALSMTPLPSTIDFNAGNTVYFPSPNGDVPVPVTFPTDDNLFADLILTPANQSN